LLGGGGIRDGKTFGHLTAVRQQVPLVKNIAAFGAGNNEPVVAMRLVGDDLAGIKIFQGEILKLGDIEIECVVRGIDRKFSAVGAFECPAIIAAEWRLGTDPPDSRSWCRICRCDKLANCRHARSSRVMLPERRRQGWPLPTKNFAASFLPFGVRPNQCNAGNCNARLCAWPDRRGHAK
jgi:hypothetical protein